MVESVAWYLFGQVDPPACQSEADSVAVSSRRVAHSNNSNGSTTSPTPSRHHSKSTRSSCRPTAESPRRSSCKGLERLEIEDSQVGSGCVVNTMLLWIKRKAEFSHDGLDGSTHEYIWLSMNYSIRLARYIARSMCETETCSATFAYVTLQKEGATVPHDRPLPKPHSGDSRLATIPLSSYRLSTCADNVSNAPFHRSSPVIGMADPPVRKA